MKNDEIKMRLMAFIKKNIPIVALKDDSFFIIRSTGLLIVKATQLRIGDIRVLQLPSKDLITGLSDDQWTTLVTKIVTLGSIVKLDLGDAFFRESYGN